MTLFIPWLIRTVCRFKFRCNHGVFIWPDVKEAFWSCSGHNLLSISYAVVPSVLFHGLSSEIALLICSPTSRPSRKGSRTWSPVTIWRETRITRISSDTWHEIRAHRSVHRKWDYLLREPQRMPSQVRELPWIWAISGIWSTHLKNAIVNSSIPEHPRVCVPNRCDWYKCNEITKPPRPCLSFCTKPNVATVFLPRLRFNCLHMKCIAWFGFL